MGDSIERILAEIRAISEKERALLFERLGGEYDFSPTLQKPMPLHLVTDELQTHPDYTLIFDGGSKGNPGPGYGSYALIREHDDHERLVRLDFDREMTNNEAEYESLIAGLAGLIEQLEASGKSPAAFTLEVRGDSALVLNQVKGTWKAKSDRMRMLRNQARALLTRLKAHRLIHHDREESVRILGH
jgi:ribonuclease HI